VTDVSVAAEWQLDEDIALSFDRTIDRRMVHRAAVSEVFITDVRPLGDRRVALAAQLPTCHRYFNDHLGSESAVDPLLMMEVCRQAGLATAYELGVSTGVVLITEDWDLRVAVPGTWRGDDPVIGLRVDSEFTWTRVRRGRPRSGTCQQRVFLKGQQIATLQASSLFLAYEELDLLRTAQRGDPPPWTADLVDQRDPELVAPYTVGRRDRLNVVLAGLAHTAGEVSARVALPLANRALFDHSYDHVTMQILTEAARQLTLAAVTASGRAIADWHLTRLAGRFMRFAELDSTVTVRATPPAPDDSSLDMSVVIEQDGNVVAEVELTMTRILAQ
jgi:hypothetical protein